MIFAELEQQAKGSGLRGGLEGVFSGGRIQRWTKHSAGGGGEFVARVQHPSYLHTALSSVVSFFFSINTASISFTSSITITGLPIISVTNLKKTPFNMPYHLFHPLRSQIRTIRLKSRLISSRLFTMECLKKILDYPKSHRWCLAPCALHPGDPKAASRPLLSQRALGK